jgi:hypothetical protein
MYVPVRHGAHTTPDTLLYVPGWHFEHEVWPGVFDSKPGWHCKQVD